MRALKRFFDPSTARRYCRAIAGETSILSLSRGKADIDRKKWLTRRRRVMVICEKEYALLSQPLASRTHRFFSEFKCFFTNFIALSHVSAL